MHKSLIFLSFFSCFSINDNRKIFDEFQLAYKQRNFQKMDEIMSDNFVAIDEYGKVAFNKQDYLAQMKGWSAVFNTEWRVKNIIEKNDSIFTVEDDMDLFDNYFYTGKIEFRYTYAFKNNQMISLRWDSLAGYIGRKQSFDAKFNLFYKWVYQNHPDKALSFAKYDSASVSELKKLLTEYISIDSSGVK